MAYANTTKKEYFLFFYIDIDEKVFYCIFGDNNVST